MIFSIPRNAYRLPVERHGAHRLVGRLAAFESFETSAFGSSSTTEFRTKGGEALLVARWFAIWTHSHCEQLVHDQLNAKGFPAFLPIVRIWSRRTGVRRLIPRPMFPGYLFVHHMVDKASYIEILKTKGIVRILGGRWDRLTPVADAEIEALQRVITTDLVVLPHPYMREGQRVRIDAGPLAGIEGIFVRSRPNRGLLGTFGEPGPPKRRRRSGLHYRDSPG